MGLSIGGLYDEARHAYEWLSNAQLSDGSWWSETLDGKVINLTKEANFSSYIAVGVFHHYLITLDTDFFELCF